MIGNKFRSVSPYPKRRIIRPLQGASGSSARSRTRISSPSKPRLVMSDCKVHQSSSVGIASRRFVTVSLASSGECGR